MSQMFTCPRGHQWGPPAEEAASGENLLCPICADQYAVPPPPRVPLAAVAKLGDLLAPSASGITPASPDEFQTVIAGDSEKHSVVEAAADLPRVTGYEILDELGRGGMGVVFRARQLRPRRMVALKMVSASLQANPDQRARFRRESEIVAQLRHANIVQIYEVGEQDGRPYFAMESLEGGNLSQKLAAAPLAAQAAAELVETLARAVHAAHLQGFVHRDLKPSNILLTGDGIPKIGDFGLGKQVEGEPLFTTVGQTQSGAILGTPSYMAPEQALSSETLGNQEPIGPSADVYGLGAIFYEALTGKPPFRAASPLATLDQVRSQEPAPPCELQPGLPLDLQTICLKCLEKSPHRRYSSALELALDLRRFVEGRPILARPITRRERFRKWARRRPAVAVLAGVCTLAVVFLVAGILWHNARLRVEANGLAASEAEARDQRERADASYQQARKTINQMVARLENKRQPDSAQLTELRQDLLEDALSFFQGIPKEEHHPDPAVRLDVALAYLQIGTIQYRRGRFTEVEENYRHALTLFEGLADANPENLEYRVYLADCYHRLANLSSSRERTGDSLIFRQKALAVRQGLTRAQPENPDWQNDLAKSYHSLGYFYQTSERPAEAEPYCLRALAIREALMRRYPEAATYQYSAAASYSNLGLIYQATGRPSQAEAAYGRAEGILVPLLRAHPEESDYACALGDNYDNWGSLLEDTGRPQEANDRYLQAIDALEVILRKEPRSRQARFTLIGDLAKHARICFALQRQAEAVKDWDRAIHLTLLAHDQGDAFYHTVCVLTASLARVGGHSLAVSGAKALAGTGWLTSDSLYRLAGVYSLSITAALGDGTLSPAEREKLTERYGAEAMALLVKLQETAYFKNPASVEHLKADAELSSLHGRADYQKLLHKLEAKR